MHYLQTLAYVFVLSGVVVIIAIWLWYRLWVKRLGGKYSTPNIPS